MWVLSLPPFSVPFLGFFALVPFFAALDLGASWKESFIYGTITFMAILYWLTGSIARYGGIPIYLSIPMVVLLSMYNGSYLAVFSHVHKVSRGIPFNALILSSFFTALEFVRSKLLTGFPWGGPGLFVERPLAMLQLASILGAIGCTFPVVLTNLLIQKGLMKKSLKKALLGLSIPIITLLYGSVRVHLLKESTKTGESIKVALCQPNIDQGVKWDRKYLRNTLRILEDMARMAKGCDLVILPETSIPGIVGKGRPLGAFLESMSRKLGAFVGAGALYRDKKGHLFNSFFMVSPESGIIGRYDKVHLVPFGEFMPLSGKLSFLKGLGIAGNFQHGSSLKIFTAKGYKFGVLICFESIFPDISRKYLKKGADFILNITNDGWFGNSPGPHQHFTFSKFRAVEEGVYFIRCANTGISAFLSPSGKVIKKLGLGKRGLIAMDLPKLKVNTIYRKWGYLFCPAVSAASLIFLSAIVL